MRPTGRPPVAPLGPSPPVRVGPWLVHNVVSPRLVARRLSQCKFTSFLPRCASRFSLFFGASPAHVPLAALSRVAVGTPLDLPMVSSLLPTTSVRGAGVMGNLIRAKDWTRTALGPVAAWPPELVHTINLMLDSKFPFVAFVGSDLVLLYNDTYIPIVGTKHPAALGMPCQHVWSEVWDVVQPMLQRVLRGEATWSHDQALMITRNGFHEECFFTWSFSPLRDATGRVVGVVAPVVETTAAVVNQRRLQTLSDLGAFNAATPSTRDACAACFRVLATHTADTTFAQLYLYDALTNTLVLQDATFMPPTAPTVQPLSGSNPSDPWPLAHVFTTRTQRVVRDLPTLFGVNFPGAGVPTSSAAICPILSPNGPDAMPIGILVLGINPRRPLDAQYMMHIDLVTRQVANAINTARNYEAGLARVQSLEELNRAKTMFFSNVSHEFRTPLTLIHTPLTEVLDDLKIPLDQLHRFKLELVQHNVSRLQKLVNTLLDFSRIETDRSHAHFRPVELGRFTVDLASAFRSAIESAGLTFDVAVDDPDAPLTDSVFVDPDMWEKIVFNLLSNAFKFTLSGSVTVRLRRGEKPPAPPSGTADQDKLPVPAAVLTVQDTGCGIPADQLGRVFERFHRVETSRGRSYEGSGIGLALTQELVHAHGGIMTVRSQVDQGSTFSVFIPLGYGHLPRDQVHLESTQHTLPDPHGSGSLGASFVEEARRWLPDHALRGFDGSMTSASTASFYGQNTSVEALVDSDVDNSIFSAPCNAFAHVVEHDKDLCLPTLATSSRTVPIDLDHDIIKGETILHWPKDSNGPPCSGTSMCTASAFDTGMNDVEYDCWLTHTLKPSAPPVVLCVDDNADMRLYMSSLLRDRVVIESAVDGAAALRLIEQAFNNLRAPTNIREAQQDIDLGESPLVPHVIVSDIMMPNTDGFALLSQLRSNPRTRHIPVILLSARAGEDARVEGIQAGADDYLCKPFSSKELIARVGLQIHVRRLRAQLEKAIRERTRALFESEERYRLLAQLSPVGMVRLDEKGRVLYANERFAEMTGLRGQPLRCLQDWHQIIHVDDVDQIVGGIQELFQGHAHHKHESFRFTRPSDGQEVSALVQAVNQIDRSTGKLQGAILSICDVTAQRRLEEERVHALQLAESIARDRAVEADEHRRQQELFVDMVCHEIRNPLNGIVNCVDLLQGNMRRRQQILDQFSLPDGQTIVYGRTHQLAELSDQIADDLSLMNSINICMNHQRKLTDDVLNLSKLMSGHINLNEEPVAPCALIPSVLEMFKAQASASLVSLRFVTPNMPMEMQQELVIVDPHRLSQIVINLVSNAIKFTTSADERIVTVSVQITPDTTSVPQDGVEMVQLTIGVADTGVGMTEAERTSLFRRFHQANVKTYSRYGGTGLGLYISKMILDLMHGHIDVQSEPGRGSVFTITVPCRSVPQSGQQAAISDTTERSTEAITSELTKYVRTITRIPAPIAHAPILHAGESTSPTSSMSSLSNESLNKRRRMSDQVVRVLVVEDNDINQRVLKRQLERAETMTCTVVLANNGLEGVEAYQRESFDAVLMDVEMPVMDGLEATRRIRAIEHARGLGARVPIIGLSGNARTVHVDAGLEAGMDGYIRKPYSKDELIQAIEDSLLGHTGRG